MEIKLGSARIRKDRNGIMYAETNIKRPDIIKDIFKWDIRVFDKEALYHQALDMMSIDEIMAYVRKRDKVIDKSFMIDQNLG